MSLIVDLAFVCAAPLCVAAEARWPRVRGQRLWTLRNLRNAVYLLLKAALVAGAGLAGAQLARYAPHRGIGSWPLALQCAVVLLAVDAKQYANHRLAHSVPWLWRFHRVHHASDELSWLAQGPTHVLEYFVMQALGTALIAWALSPAPLAWVLGAALPSTLVGGMLAHLNCDWPRGRLGWVGRVIVTPNYHGHHHGLHPRGVNLAEVLPLWDLAFGTFEEPPATPTAFGLHLETGFPEGIVAQQLSALRREYRAGETARGVEARGPGDG